MVLARYAVPDAELGGALITVTAFPGETGGLLANVNRWRNEIKLAAVDQGGLSPFVSSLELKTGKATLVDMTSEPAEGARRDRLMVAIVPHAGDSWFFKIKGPEQVVSREKESFLKFVQSVQFPNAP